MCKKKEKRERKNIVFEEGNQDQEDCTQMAKNISDTMKNLNETEQLKDRSRENRM